MDNKYLQLVGLAFRANKCSIGEERIIKDIQQQTAKLVLLAEDIGQQTRKKITDKCKSYNIPYMIVADRYTLAQAIGKENIVAIAIRDTGFARSIQSKV